MMDAGSRPSAVTVHRIMDTEHGLGNVTDEMILKSLLNHWIKFCGKENIVRMNSEGAFRNQGFDVVLLSKVFDMRNGFWCRVL